MQGKEGSGGSSAVYFNPVQVDMQWIRRVQKEEKILMDSMDGTGTVKQSTHRQPNKIDDVYQHFGSAYFYQSEYLKNHMYINGGPPATVNPYRTSIFVKNANPLSLCRSQQVSERFRCTTSQHLAKRRRVQHQHSETISRPGQHLTPFP